VCKQASKYLGKEIVNHGLLCFRIPNVLLFLEQGESENPNFGTQKQTNIPILGFATIFFSVLLLYGTSQTPCLNSGSREIPSPMPLSTLHKVAQDKRQNKSIIKLLCVCV